VCRASPCDDDDDDDRDDDARFLARTAGIGPGRVIFHTRGCF
jgi:hypothetical protein